MSFTEIVEKELRLVALKLLAEQPDRRLNSSLMREALADSWAINRSREWVHIQIRFLAEIGAVTITDAGTVLIATLTDRGLDHVERRVVLDGVKRPSLGA